MVSFDRLDSMRQDDSLDKLLGDKEGGGNTGETTKKRFLLLEIVIKAETAYTVLSLLL